MKAFRLAQGGALLVIGALHFARLALLSDPFIREFVAASGGTIYSLAGLGIIAGTLTPRTVIPTDWARYAGQGTAILGPVIGVTTVLASGSSIDAYQAAVGALQAAVLVAVSYDLVHGVR